MSSFGKVDRPNIMAVKPDAFD